MGHPFDKRLRRGDPRAAQNKYDRGGNIKISVQDQSTSIVDLHLSEVLNTTALAVDAQKDDKSVTLQPGHGALVGDTIYFQEYQVVIDNHDLAVPILRTLQIQILTVVGDVIGTDCFLDFPYTTNAIVQIQNVDLNVDGSITPRIFSLTPLPYVQIDAVVGDGGAWDIVRTMFYLQSGANPAMNDQLFGNVTELANGIILRKKNDDTYNIFNIKKNGQFRLRNFDAEYVDTVRGGGSQSFSSRRTTGGQSKNGVTIRLDSEKGDSLQVVVQDDLSSLEDFSVIAQGHLVDPF